MAYLPDDRDVATCKRLLRLLKKLKLVEYVQEEWWVVDRNVRAFIRKLVRLRNES